MYKKRDKAQLSMDEFYLPFGDGLDANNRWVKIARIIPLVCPQSLYQLVS
jgi:hypothetical protein